MFGLESPGQMILTCQWNISQHCWTQHVACVWSHAFVLQHVGCCWLKFRKWPNVSQKHPKCRNMPQQSGQTSATCCTHQLMLQYVVFAYCDHLAGA